MSDYHHGTHSVFAIHLHLVWVTKYRKPVLVGDVAFKTRELIREICRSESVEIIKGHISKDHIHLFVSVPPQSPALAVNPMPLASAGGAFTFPRHRLTKNNELQSGRFSHEMWNASRKYSCLVTSRGTHLHRNFQAVSITGIRTTPMEIEQCQTFDGPLTRKSTMSPHGGPVALPVNNIATFTIFPSNLCDSGPRMWHRRNGVQKRQKLFRSVYRQHR